MMDNEQAIIVLQWLHDNDYVSQYMKEDVKKATEMAINALSTETKGGSNDV
jgi:hypothetical protein